MSSVLCSCSGVKSQSPSAKMADAVVGVEGPAVQGVAPFGQGVVEAHAEACAAHGGGEFFDDVAPRAAHGAVPLGLVGVVPEGIAVVVLGDEEDVLRSGVAEHLRPLVGLPQLGVPVAGELGVHFAHRQ